MEIKLRKHLNHGNVGETSPKNSGTGPNEKQIVNLLDIFISPAEDMYAVSLFTPSLRFLSVNMRSYLVTDLMKTDLETLLKAKPIENEFVQYLIYQIMVKLPVTCG
jgi:p38 MAP kinase